MSEKNTNKQRPFRTQIMTPKEAARYLGLHLVTIYRLIKKGQLPGFKIGGQWRFKKDLLDEWIKRFKKDLLDEWIKHQSNQRNEKGS